ncbi:MAG: hypothetical protein ACXWC8_21895 [Limisphaerales bacterium]
MRINFKRQFFGGIAVDDKDKNVIEKLVDQINDAIENIATTASEALRHAMEAEPEKAGERTVAFMPIVGDGSLPDTATPSVVAIPRRKKSTSKKAPTTSGKKASKKAAKKSSKGAVKKSSAKKKAAKARKPAAVRKKKPAKKAAKKKKAKKSRRK